MRFEVWFVTIVPLVSVAIALIAGASRGPWTPVRLIGGALTVAVTILLTIARLNLGDSFSIAPEARKLVTHGVYSRIRNPVYVFSALLICGLALYLRFPALFATLAILVPMQIVRARRERRVLEAKFGEEYRAYKRATWF